MAIDLTHGINPHQSVEGMVHDWNKKEAKADAEADATANDKPEFNYDNERMVKRGRLNADTGIEIPMTPKARKVASWVPSKQFQDNFDLIDWGYDEVL